MTTHEKYMHRCIQLALKGAGKVAPNPMVGCVIVYKNKIIGEGYHQQFGGPHAEINAIDSVKDASLLKGSTLFVNLEPCSHYGKTPPCCDAIIQKGIKHIVVGSIDPNPLVKGKGVYKLLKNGCSVITGVLEKECEELNKRFFTYYKCKRPYIILKWAQTSDGFIDRVRTKEESPEKITGLREDKLTHQWRSEEQAILVGTNTILMDNPQLTVRLIKGNNPIRLVIDKTLKIPKYSNIYSNFAKTIIITEKPGKPGNRIEYMRIKFDNSLVQNLMNKLYKKNIQSVLVEGGRITLNSFIEKDCWDEARVFISSRVLGDDGIRAPTLSCSPVKSCKIGISKLNQYYNSSFLLK